MPPELAVISLVRDGSTISTRSCFLRDEVQALAVFRLSHVLRDKNMQEPAAVYIEDQDNGLELLSKLDKPSVYSGYRHSDTLIAHRST